VTGTLQLYEGDKCESLCLIGRRLTPLMWCQVTQKRFGTKEINSGNNYMSKIISNGRMFAMFLA
jgi:hypothetical protein